MTIKKLFVSAATLLVMGCAHHSGQSYLPAPPPPPYSPPLPLDPVPNNLKGLSAQIAMDSNAIIKWNSYRKTRVRIPGRFLPKYYRDCVQGEFDLVAKRDQSPNFETNRRADQALLFLRRQFGARLCKTALQ